MTNNKLLCTGAAGSVITAICCFTPALVVLFAALGVSAWLDWIDYVLFPLLAIFILITVYALARRAKKTRPDDSAPPETLEAR